MDYYTLGKTGLRVSRLALGTMTFGEDWGWGAEESTARQIFDKYLEAGGNFIDTADMYTNGNSEKMLGQFVKESGSRDRVVISTKFSYSAQPGNPNAGGNGRKNIMRAVEGSLRRLNTDYIDLYILHTWDQVTPAEEVMRSLDNLVTAGKVRHVALSDVPAWYMAQAQTLAQERHWEPISTIQLEYSLVERNIEFEYVPLVKALGSGIMVWSPLASGLLSGKYKPSKESTEGSGTGAEGSGRLSTLAGGDNPAFNKFTEQNWAIVAELEKVAKEINRSMAQVAVNWVVNRPGVASVLMGATKLHQLEDNLGALDFSLPTELQQRLDEVSQPDSRFPYTFFEPSFQGMIHGGAAVGDKPVGYSQPIFVPGEKQESNSSED
ncbi:aldo/keto reductase [cf. Phormidesmis sp. LEGE 11477]|uniref:aldo/keto reductase n=1 Tax=cf. Phormidesmis sp. LEGE 11477 TaxID=1828680 RepID=UPI00187EAED4|nr:aldo/keto reductase [cf. Phormidesmis sp. LEGE 11477]MBE9063942.1 aldo/keto reductase [cf. Phormidesmis sp. LEGE 11477]